MSEAQKNGEFDLIDRYFKPLSTGTGGAFGLTDDAGQLTPEPGHAHILTCDALVKGVHFLPDTTGAEAVGYKALSVNVSDLCAKGANPVAYLLAIALGKDEKNDAWLCDFANGLKKAQSDYGCGLLGGDTVVTPGPTVITITAIGSLPEGSMTHRSDAGAGDLVYVTGTIGDAALGLALLKGEEPPDALTGKAEAFLKQRHLKPEARLDAVPLVREFATASMDISDGLVGDFMKLASASSLGGNIRFADIPFSQAAQIWRGEDPDKAETMITGGDDYEILMTVNRTQQQAFEAAARKYGVQITRIGVMTGPGSDVVLLDDDGAPLEMLNTGYEHF